MDITLTVMMYIFKFSTTVIYYSVSFLSNFFFKIFQDEINGDRGSSSIDYVHSHQALLICLCQMSYRFHQLACTIGGAIYNKYV